MNLNRNNYINLVDFIKTIFPYAKTPTDAKGIAMWINDLAEYDILTVLEAIRCMQEKQNFFDYSKLLKQVKGVIRNQELSVNITNKEVWDRVKMERLKQAKRDYERFFGG